MRSFLGFIRIISRRFWDLSEFFRVYLILIWDFSRLTIVYGRVFETFFAVFSQSFSKFFGTFLEFFFDISGDSIRILILFILFSNRCYIILFLYHFLMQSFLVRFRPEFKIDVFIYRQHYQNILRWLCVYQRISRNHYRYKYRCVYASLIELYHHAYRYRSQL